MTASTLRFRSGDIKRPSVYFNTNPIESTSRPLYRSELYSLRQFEDHVYDSTGCYQSLKVLRLTGICSYCREMAGCILTLFKPWAEKYLQISTHSHLPTFVEIPEQFTVTRYVLTTLMKDDSYRCEPSHPAVHHSKRFYSFAGYGIDQTSRRWSSPEIYSRPNRSDRSIWREENTIYSLERLRITLSRD
jgi:hypothetical protein